jgi:hypothetical protein
MMAQSWKALENFSEPLVSYTTLLFEHAAEADSQIAQLHSFSLAKPTPQGRLPR